jgi:hypothetical protein
LGSKAFDRVVAKIPHQQVARNWPKLERVDEPMAGPGDIVMLGRVLFGERHIQLAIEHLNGA